MQKICQIKTVSSILIRELWLLTRFDRSQSNLVILQSNLIEGNLRRTVAVDNNYSPSFSEFKAFLPHILQVFDISERFQFHSLNAVNLISTSVSPPVIFLVNSVSLPDICVFRI